MSARRRAFVALASSLLVAVVGATAAAGAPPHLSDSPASAAAAFGTACAAKHATNAKASCYVKLLLRDIERSGNPSRELPQLDAETRAAGGFIAAACHALMHQVGYSWHSSWLQAAIALYLLAGACWLPVVMLQLRVRNLSAAALREAQPLPPAYFRCMRWWFALGWPAFLSVLGAFWLMIAKPDLW
jgi:hypothetical protein